jgi:2-iminobutanoate/2-iminopropanoate deaminase
MKELYERGRRGNMDAIFTEQAPQPIGPYSQAVKAGEWLFVSGQVPIDPATGAVAPGGIREQTRQVLANLTAVLAAAGATPARVVKTTVYLIDLKEFAEFNQAYAAAFTAPYPARAVVQVAALPVGARVEISAVVRLDR